MPNYFQIPSCTAKLWSGHDFETHTHTYRERERERERESERVRERERERWTNSTCLSTISLREHKNTAFMMLMITATLSSEIYPFGTLSDVLYDSDNHSPTISFTVKNQLLQLCTARTGFRYWSLYGYTL